MTSRNSHDVSSCVFEEIIDKRHHEADLITPSPKRWIYIRQFALKTYGNGTSESRHHTNVKKSQISFLKNYVQSSVFNPLHVIELFLNPLKTFEKLWFSVFKRYRKRPVACHGLMHFTMNPFISISKTRC